MAADFLVAITAGFRVLYVFVVMEVGSRRILHCKVTAHPTAGWTLLPGFIATLHSSASQHSSASPAKLYGILTAARRRASSSPTGSFPDLR